MNDFVEDIRLRFQNVENQSQAVKMAAYMKNIAPFFGVSSIPRKMIFNKWKETLPKDLSFEERWELIFLLWEQEEREFQYVAVDLINSWNKNLYQKDDLMNLQMIIQSKSWWDTIDLLASNFLSNLIVKFPDLKLKMIEKWSDTTDFWLLRSTLIWINDFIWGLRK
jgi:3-methyladenine DNA glycosylase AlkD